MTATEIMTTPEGKLREGDTIHFTEAVSAWGYVRARGASVVLTAEMIAATINARGTSWLDAVDTEGARIARGAWPAGAPTWRWGDRDWEEHRDRAKKALAGEHDPEKHARMIAEFRAVYGPPKSAQVSGAPVSIHDAEKAEEQRRRLDATGPRVVNNYAPGRYPDEETETARVDRTVF